ncbi:hypothetical protein NLJ89_g5616 [Agrocybe chaxingu]|uniref:Uncharacterized protein n=1 Tax=Agrocybe chaxingu TaxID=84603 RepID=A0A9W8K706_9AGAR|nr:hypothetical protein NLJ89_g5616 [Agrocybe chaxingu]
MGTTRATDPIDPLPKNRAPRDLEHNSHFDITLWHHELHPQIVKECARNSLPKAVGRYFHPTHVHLRFIKDDGEGERWQLWSSRDHRKQRHVEVSPKTQRPRHGATFWDRLTHMRNVEYWNVSWWVAQTFTWGSVVWVVNAFTAFLPFVNSRVSRSPDITGWTAFVGATIFEIGSVLGILEAWNRDDRANFGWGISIHHPSTDNAVLNNGQPYKPSGDPFKFDSLEEKRVSGDKKWIYFPANSKYWREMGFLAAFFQLIGATIFWISGFTAIPQIQSAIEDKTDLFNGVFWTPQVVGGSGFIISS